ncbi:hypothetical protein C8Q80DRAFT_871169 [Daedaleopsis nitida]|nr:hypothetical protein C8Q80DRAFT_871169 [Daedaleopsis nitida]
MHARWDQIDNVSCAQQSQSLASPWRTERAAGMPISSTAIIHRREGGPASSGHTRPSSSEIHVVRPQSALASLDRTPCRLSISSAHSGVTTTDPLDRAWTPALCVHSPSLFSLRPPARPVQTRTPCTLPRAPDIRPSVAEPFPWLAGYPPRPTKEYGPGSRQHAEWTAPHPGRCHHRVKLDCPHVCTRQVRGDGDGTHQNERRRPAMSLSGCACLLRVLGREPTICWTARPLPLLLVDHELHRDSFGNPGPISAPQRRDCAFRVQNAAIRCT